MIDINEIRIGNFLMQNKIFIREVKIEDFQSSFFLDAIKAGNLNPIPLTDGWLEKAGFSLHSRHLSWYKEINVNWRKKPIILHIIDKSRVSTGYEEEKKLCRYSIEYSGGYLTHFDYVHEFQQLYFWLLRHEVTFSNQ